MSDLLNVCGESTSLIWYNVQVTLAEFLLNTASNTSMKTGMHMNVIPDLEVMLNVTLLFFTVLGKSLFVLGTLRDAAAVVTHLAALGVVVLALRAVPLVRVAMVVGRRAGF